MDNFYVVYSILYLSRFKSIIVGVNKCLYLFGNVLLPSLRNSTLYDSSSNSVFFPWPYIGNYSNTCMPMFISMEKNRLLSLTGSLKSQLFIKQQQDVDAFRKDRRQLVRQYVVYRVQISNLLLPSQRSNLCWHCGISVCLKIPCKLTRH